ncbi:MAG: dTMP kinase [Gemmatimonadaceae bacterium]
MSARGTLIVFDGAEGSGKTTQMRKLVARLGATGVACLAVREPGGTPLGDAIRALLLDPRREIGATAEALLFMASRAQLIERQVAPALDAGTLVIVDRFFLSTYAYQIAGRGLEEKGVRDANALATSGIRPDITILLTVTPDVGLARMRKRADPDRMERADAAFHDRVAAAFAQYATEAWQRAHPECGRIVAVDGSRSEEVVEQDIAAILAHLINTDGSEGREPDAAKGGRSVRAADTTGGYHA